MGAAKLVLSKRLCAVAAMVTKGNTVCDVGCDHGYVPIYLIQNGISPRVIAMDVGKGPLEAAKENIAGYDLLAYIETRRSDGLSSFVPGEAQTMICAGMGGLLIKKIITEQAKKAESFEELILQPQSGICELRQFLRLQGYQIADEDMIAEDGKYYPMMRVVRTGTDMKANALSKQQLEDKYGPVLLQKKNSVLCAYLEREKRIQSEILEQLKMANRESRRGEAKKEEILLNLQEIEQALAKMGGSI